MKQIKHKDYVLVEVPIHSTGFEIDFGGKNIICHGEYVDAGYIETKEGNYKIVGLAKDLTEEQWAIFGLKYKFKRRKNYDNKYAGVSPFTCDTATESGRSFVKHHSLELNRTLIIKKII